MTVRQQCAKEISKPLGSDKRLVANEYGWNRTSQHSALLCICSQELFYELPRQQLELFGRFLAAIALQLHAWLLESHLSINAPTTMFSGESLC
eukprot:4031634-Amphidinium_carterae.2